MTAALLLGLTACGHDSKTRTVAAPTASTTATATATVVQPEAVTAPPAATMSPAPKAATRSKPAPTATAKAAGATTGAGGAARFVAAVQRKLPEFALDRRDEEVTDLGEQACEALGAGRSATAAAGEVAERGVTRADARTLAGLAREDLCRG